jgi:copper chaperone CopZ
MALFWCGAETLFAAPQDAFTVQIVASEMCCKGCAQQVAAQLYALPGVTQVQADVPKRLVNVTAKRSPKLTLERIWNAVEKGKGRPSKLVINRVNYEFTRPDGLNPDQQVLAGRYTLQVRSLDDKDAAQNIANQLYKVRGVEKISVDVPKRTLFIQPANGAMLSPWALTTAAEAARSDPVSVGGPFGVLTIKRPSDSEAATVGRAALRFNQGDVR